MVKKSAIFIQNACLQHRYIRSKDTSNIYERPERLRAVTVGLSAAIARLEGLFNSTRTPGPTTTSEGANKEPDPDDLADVMNKLKIDSELSTYQSPVSIIESQATVDILNHPAVKFVHGDLERDVYLENLTAWAKESHQKISKGESEIPEGLSQGDLYRELIFYLSRPVNMPRQIYFKCVLDLLRLCKARLALFAKQWIRLFSHRGLL